MLKHPRSSARSAPALALITLSFAMVACNAKAPTPPPDAPTGVSAIAANGSVTVSWEASAGATGYRVYYNAVSAGVVSNSSLAVDAGTALFVSVGGLVNGTMYGFAVAARGISGEGAISAEVTATPMVNAPLAVATTLPIDGAASVSRATPISITFNKPATVSSITTQSTDGACSGSVQLSMDGFTTCVAFKGSPVSSSGGASFAFTLNELLQGTSTYALRVTTAARDANGIALAAQYTQANGFGTAAALAVSSISPADGSTLVALNTTVTATFNGPLTASSLTANTTDTNCTGSIQLSTGAFAAMSCVKVATATISGNSVVLTPAAPLPPGALVQLRATTALLDATMLPLGAAFTSAGFTTSPPLSVAQVTPADGLTNVDFQPTISVAFAAPAASATISTNISASTACSGSIQVSKASSNFAANSCVPMAAQPATADGGTTFTMTPAGLLASSTKYLIRVTTAATDMSGAPLASVYTSQGFTTRAFAVSSISPVDGASAVPRNGTIAITFNRPVGAASIGTGACAGPFLLTETGAQSCTVLAVPSVNGAVVTLTPAAILDGAANYKLQVTASLLDDSGGALQPFATTTGFTTSSGLAVASTEPSNGQTSVPENVAMQIVFNQATLPASITAQTAAGACTGSIQLSVMGQTSCLGFSAAPSSLDSKTYMLTPSPVLTASTHYRLVITTGAEDASGVGLPANVESDFTTGTGVDTTPPGEVGSLTNATALQSISLTWTNPPDIDFSKARIHLCANGVAACTLAQASSVVMEVNGSPSATANVQVAGLIASTEYNLLVTTVDQSGNESAGTTAQATTGFSGLALDFTNSQKTLAVGAGTGGQAIAAWFTWNATALYAGIGNTDGSSLLTANRDVLWIAIDTDPDTDATGEQVTGSIGSNNIIWPFKADYIVQLIPNGTSTSVQVRAAAAATPCALIIAPVNSDVTSACANATGALNYDGTFAGGIDEVAIPASAIGSPTKVRLAFAALNSGNGYAYALAPANPNAIDVIGYFGSVTSSFNPGINIFNTAQAATSALPATSPISTAAELVTLSVQSAGGGTPTLKGSLHPLSYTLTDTSFALRDDGTGGDVTAGDGIYTGVFNFGGVSQELFFKYGLPGAAPTDEFAAGSDRIWTLSGSTEAMPQVSYGVAYSKTHAFQLTFEVTSPLGTTNDKEVVGNVAELGNFTPGMGAALTSVGNSVWVTAAVMFKNYDFTTTSLQWKARDNGSDTWENDSGGTVANHQMNDDVLNARVISWTWNDYSHDPF